METTLALKKTHYPANARGKAEHGWLQSRFSFSFANFYDPTKVHFGVLRVLNDDIIAGGMGFGMHPHDNMEIITIPIEGEVEHKDNAGNHGIITAGEVQVMSAGSGVYHSEKNHQHHDPLKLFQIWVFPNRENVPPRYDQMKFDLAARKNAFQTVISPFDDQLPNSLWIYQDAYFSLGNFDASQKFAYQLKNEGNGLYIFVIKGKVTVAEETLGERDALGLENLNEIDFETESGVELLLMEIPMN